MKTSSKRPIQMIEHSNDHVALHEAARIGSGLAFGTSALFILLVTRLLGGDSSPRTPLLWLIALILIAASANRMLGSTAVFDLHDGIVRIVRTLGRIRLFTRSFPMNDVARVFHDERAYVRIKIQNPKLELTNGRFVNLSPWCPVETDLETEIAAANRILYRWKQGVAESAGEKLPPFAEYFAGHTPKLWTPAGMAALDSTGKISALQLARRCGAGFLVLGSSYVLSNGYIPFQVRQLLFLVSSLLFTGMIAGLAALFVYQLTDRGSGDNAK